MSTKYTSQFPMIWMYTVLSPVVAFFALPAGALSDTFPSFWKSILTVAFAIFLIETVGIMNKMPLSMMIRKILTIPRDFIVGESKTLSSPASWRRRIGPFVALALLSGFARADYSISDSMMYEKNFAASQVGMTQEDVINASCDECSINAALEIIVPSIYRVVLDRDLGNSDIEVSFEGRKPWGEFLKETLTQAQLSGELIRYSNMLVVTKAPSAKEVGMTYTNLVGAKSSFFETKTFNVRSGDTFGETVKRWAKSEGWDAKVDLATNLRLTTNVAFEGNLIEAVYQLIYALKQRGLIPSAFVRQSDMSKTITITREEEK